MNHLDSSAPLDSTRCYKLGGILYVPHYTLHGQFVRPGFCNPSPTIRPDAWTTMRDIRRVTMTVSEMELVARGATATTEFLWRRPNRIQQEAE